MIFRVKNKPLHFTITALFWGCLTAHWGMRFLIYVPVTCMQHLLLLFKSLRDVYLLISLGLLMIMCSFFSSLH